jgi:hypothetical protein
MSSRARWAGLKHLKDGIERFGQGQVPQVAREQELCGVACAMLKTQAEPVCRKRRFRGREETCLDRGSSSC